MLKVRKMLVDDIFGHFRNDVNRKYDEEKHCKMLINVMMDPERGTIASFCLEALILERTFNKWVVKYELFRDLYYFSKMIAREVWEDEGRKIRDTEYQIGTINYAFEHWKMIGWTRFGVGRNSRLKLDVEPGASPAKHYEAILKQAAEGDFTASEFKQLMEAVNVGLNVHQVFELQKQIDELKSNLAIMSANTNVKNPFTDKGAAKKD